MIIISYQQHADYPLIVASNRDEFYRRHAAPLAWWEGGQVLAGRDLGYTTLAGRLLGSLGIRKKADAGTWLGVNRDGRFAAITNIREPGKDSKTAKSRGLLVSRFLNDRITISDFIDELTQNAGAYNGYNLLFGSASELWHFNNRSGVAPTRVEPGLHVLSNATLDSPWPKALLAREKFGTLGGNPPAMQDVFAMLSNAQQADEQTVQRTGLPLKYEIALSSIFIALQLRRGLFRRKVGYGTRASSYVKFPRAGEVEFYERTYTEGKPGGDRSVRFAIGKD